MLGAISAMGYPALGVAVLLSAAFAPLPVSMVLAAAGALARQGRLDLGLLGIVVVGAAVAGDCLGYAAGRYGLGRLPLSGWWAARIGGCGPQPSPFGRLDAHLGLLVFLTRWALTAPAPLVNVLAGTRRYPWRAFLFLDLVGQLLWCVSTLGLGFWLGQNGELGVPLSTAAGLAVGVIGVLFSRRQAAKAILARVARSQGGEGSVPRQETAPPAPGCLHPTGV